MKNLEDYLYYEEKNPDLKIYCGCNSEILNLIPSVDLVVTSPPYNKNGFRGHRDSSNGKGRWAGADIQYDSISDDMEEKEYHLWQIMLLNSCHKLLNERGSIFYNHKIRRANCSASHPMEWILKSSPKFYQQIIWNRLSGCDHNINYLDPITELIFWLVKEKPICKKQTSFATEVWEFPPDVGNDHPAPFPLGLAKRCILLASEDNGIVLDPFLGSGTTLVACKELNRKGIGIEISEKYCAIAKQRLKATTRSLF